VEFFVDPKDDWLPLVDAASALGRRSAEVRQKKWGKKEFKKRMREWGNLGGRPKKADGERKGKQ
jgi:hypothetical protein